MTTDVDMSWHLELNDMSTHKFPCRQELYTEIIKTVEYLHSFILFISQVMQQRPSMSSAAPYEILRLCHLLIADGDRDVHQIGTTPQPGMGGNTLTLSMQITPMGLR